MTSRERDTLDRDGYVVFQEVLDARAVGALRREAMRVLEEVRRDPAVRIGETRHVDLPAGGDSPFAGAWAAPNVAEAIHHLLRETSAPHRASFRSPNPGYGAQMLHRDWAEPGKPGCYVVATLLVTLCDFTETNGATRVVPGSQHLPGTPSLVDADTPHLKQRIIICPAGSAIVLNGHLWHSGTRNRSNQSRDALQVIFQASTGAKF